MKRWLAPLAVLALAAPAPAQEAVERDFKLALQLQNARELERACRAIVAAGRPDGAKLVLGALKQPLEPESYWVLVRAAAAFQSSRALALVAEFALEHKARPVARDLTMALHNNFSSAAEEALCAILAQGPEELRISALDHLMDIGKKSSVSAALEVLRTDTSREVRRRAFRLLTVLTGQDYGESVSNWTGWWEANKDKPWEQLTPKLSLGTTTLGRSREGDYERLKEAKVLFLHAGESCKCGKNHDMDPNIFRVLRQMPFEVEAITKDKFEADKKVDDAWLKRFIAIIAICTQIREHCACPTCQPGSKSSLRMFQ